MSSETLKDELGKIDNMTIEDLNKIEEKKRELEDKLNDDNNTFSDLGIKKIESKKKSKIPKNNNADIIPEHPFRLGVVGSSGSGKTNLIINLLLEHKFYAGYFHFIYLFSSTYYADDSWDAIKPEYKGLEDELVFDEFDEEKLAEIFNNQKTIVEKKGVHKAPRVLMIFDDIITDAAVQQSPMLKVLFTRGRHNSISIIASVQKYKLLPTIWRQNLTHFITFRPNNGQEAKAIAEEQALKMSTKEMEDLLYTATSTPHSFLYIKKRTDVPLNERYMKNFEMYLLPKAYLDNNKE